MDAIFAVTPAALPVVSDEAGPRRAASISAPAADKKKAATPAPEAPGADAAEAGA